MSPSVRERVPVVRAALAVLWAGALVAALGGDVPTTSSAVPAVAAALLAAYPVIDVVASLVEAAAGGPSSRVLRVNAGIGAVAAAALAGAGFGADAGATLAVFGAWAAVSGAIQLAVAVRRRRAGRRELPMVLSGGLSTLAGLMFLLAAGMDAAHLANLGGYMAVGAVLYLVAAVRRRAA